MIFSPQGRLDCVARGTSKKSGLLEPLTCVRIQVKTGRGLPWLQEIALEKTYPTILSNFLYLQWAGYWIHLWLESFGDEGESQQAYRLLRLCLDALDLGLEPAWLVSWADLQVSQLLGSAPQLQACVRCDSQVVERFSLESGGMLCRRCSSSHRGFLVEPAVIQWLRFLQRVPLARLTAGRPRPQEVLQVRQVMDRWMVGLFPKMERFLPGGV